MSEQTTVPESHRTVGGNLGVSRRGFMRAGAAATGAAAVGYGTTRAPRFSPVGQAEAALPIAVGIAVVGFAGVVAYNEFIGNDGEDPDFSELDDSQAELEMYNLVSSVQTTQEPHYRDIGNSWRLTWGDEPYSSAVDIGDPEATNYADAAWSDIRAAISETYNNGGTVSEAVSNANDALDRTTTKAGINLIETHNAQYKALAQAVYETHERSLSSGIVVRDGSGGQLSGGNASNTVTPVTKGSEPLQSELDTSSGESLFQSAPVTFPADLSEIEDVDDDAEYRIFMHYLNHSSFGARPAVPWNEGQFTGASDAFMIDFATWGDEGMEYSYKTRLASDGDMDENFSIKVGVHQPRFSQAFTQLDDAYKAIRGGIQDYAEAVQDQIAAGDLDPDDILTAHDIVTQYDDGDTTDRIIAELAAAGMTVPENLGDDVQITIDHDDVGEATGWLFINTDTDGDLTVTEGGEIAAADYSSAYLVRQYEDSNGDQQTDAEMLRPTRQEDTDDDGTMETVNQPISIVEIHSDADELTYSQYVTSVSDPTSGDDLQEYVETISKLREEIEALREEEASDPGGAGGGWQSDGKTLGIVALAAALGALLLGGSGE